MAATGIAVGPIWSAERNVAPRPAADALDAETELERLRTAMADAAASLGSLGADGGMGAEILDFQTEMLADPALLEEVLPAIAVGRAAAAAWSAALDDQIAGFRAADDDYFRARADDLVDLRDRVLDALGGGVRRVDEAPPRAIVTARDLTPSRFLEADWDRLGGLALGAGSRQSHVAMLARARGVPMVVGLGDAPTSGPAALDADGGALIVDPEPATLEAFEQRRAVLDERAAAAKAALAGPALTAKGERIQCLLNLDHADAVADEVLDGADGVGLWRTEFLFLDRPTLPTEDEQAAAYGALTERLDGRPVVVRTLDVGGDKSLPGVTIPEEGNPFLGLRGLRLCLERPELFRPQLRALLRAAAVGPLQIMLPMVTVPAEVVEARALLEDCLTELRATRTAAAMPSVGMMVETPASAIGIERFPVDFVSIGSNDLTQYVMAAARDAGGRVGRLADPLDPAVLHLIGKVVADARHLGLPVSLCGDMAADPIAAMRLLDLGMTRLSVGPAALGQLKLTVADHGR